MRNVIYKALIGCFCLSTIAVHGGEDMKLVYKDKVLIEIEGDRAFFHDTALELEMTKQGIYIPPALQKEYGNKQFIKADEPQFGQAFKMIYYPTKYQSTNFNLIDS